MSRSYDGSGTIVNSVGYANDPLDRPVAQTSSESGSTTTYDLSYVGISDRVAGETLSGATNSTRRYAFDAFGRRATIADGANRYGYLHDPHGSVSLVLDQAGTVKASYGYTAYGASNAALTKAAAGFSLAVNAYRYTGKRLDTASNTLDMGARRFSRASGRFLQVDSYDGALANLSLSRSPLMGNRYALAGGNPVNYIEADGHVVVLDDTGGKPFTGYGSGPNSDSPVATPEQTAAMMMEVVQAMSRNFDSMCRDTEKFSSQFCQSMAKEGLATHTAATGLAGGGDWGRALSRYAGTCVIAGIQGGVLTSGGGVTALGGAATGCFVAVTAKALKSKGKGTNSYAAGQVLDLGYLARDIRAALVKAVGAKSVPSIPEIIRLYRESMRTAGKGAFRKTYG